jgi:hypothetical protein
MKSLMHRGNTVRTWLNVLGFSNVQNGTYWTSSTVPNPNNLAWVVDMSWLEAVNSLTKTYSVYVWPVRGGDGGGLIQLPRTGQTTSYATGDDGALQKGVSWNPATRFTINSNGTVTDNLTGLIWLMNANCIDTLGGISKAGQLSWANALIWSNYLASGACGLSDGSVAGDWRLSNVYELESLIDLQYASPSLSSGHPFSNVKSNYYWSSSSHVNDRGRAFPVAMAYGHVIPDATAAPDYVWPVRCGQ